MIAKRTWPLIACVALAGIVAYFIYHTVEGERGWIAQIHLQGEVDKAQAALDKLHKERQELEHRVQLMRPESLDPDLLDEESRKTLNYSRPGEVIILSPPDKTQSPPQN